MTPAHDPAFWPARMTRDGCTATAEQMAEAWAAWWPRLPEHRAYLVVDLPINRISQPWAHRLADAMLQRARKAGIIEYRQGRWWPVEGEK